jgi:cation/acetate symporter
MRRSGIYLCMALFSESAFAQGAAPTRQNLALLLFVGVLVVSGVIIFWASRRTRSVSSFYAAEGAIGGVRNGIAIAGDFLSAAAFLGIGGLFTIYGFDAFTYTVGFVVALALVLFLVAEPCRNLGRYTIGDILAFRHDARTAKALAAVSTVTIAVSYLIPQLVGGGLLLQLLMGIPFEVAVVIVGVLMLLYVVFGGMLATTWIQIVKAMLLVSTTLLLLVLALRPFGFDPAALVAAAVSDPKVQAQMAHVAGASALGLSNEKLGELALAPGWLIQNPWDRLSLFMGLLFGTAALPHVLMRFFTVPNAKAARVSVVWGMGLVGLCNICFIFTGFAAAYYVGADRILAADPGGNLAVPLLAQYLGGGADTLSGNLFLAFVAAVACATIVAVVAGAVLSAASAMAHDLYVGVFRGNRASEREQVTAARIAALVIGLVAVTLSVLSKGKNVAHLVGLAFAIAASANFATIVLTLYWRRFTTAGLILGMTVGLVSAIACVMISPNMEYPLQLHAQATQTLAVAEQQLARALVVLAEPTLDVTARNVAVQNKTRAEKLIASAHATIAAVSGRETSLLGLRKPLLSLRNPAIISVPLAFLAAILGSLLFPDATSRERYTELRARRTVGVRI